MRCLFLVFAVTCLLVTPSLGLQVSNNFETYVKKYNKHYSEAEYKMRKSLFEKSLLEIAQHDNTTYSKGINQFSDWTEEEKRNLNGLRRSVRSRVSLTYKKSFSSWPSEVDYRLRAPSVLTAIKNQGHCGSCWAHSAVEAIETHYALQTGLLYDLSQQQLTSCTPNPRHCGGRGGCEGLVENLAFEYVKNAGGITEEWSYPYTSFNGDSGMCRRGATDPVVKVSDFVQLEPNDEDAIVDALVTKGPLAVSVDASGWHSYSGGIFDGCDYGRNITTNHAVQLVGYGYDYSSKQKYWIIRNSWGPRWGEKGFMRLLRHDVKKCGWNVDTHSGSACDGDPDEEWVCGMCGILSSSSYPIVR